MLPISVCRFARRRSCPGVSPQRFDSPWHARLFIGDSWHTSPGDHIPAGRLFNCQGACHSLVPIGIGEMNTPSAENCLSDNKKTAGNSFVYWNFRLKQYFEIFLESVEKWVKICYNIKKVNS